ncbi:hypothetical protein [Reichenbachiella sp. MALMAid0571]|uniref:hypothetical protein n=1 Tax=Reichenbachiella sp. MALMAid0571 TaxID=3143939 RepID=UPI0032DFB6B5
MNRRNVEDYLRKLFRLKQKDEAKDNDDTNEAIDYAFTFETNAKERVLKEHIKEIVVLSPWATVTPHHINFHKAENDRSQVEVQFGALSKRKGKLIEDEIRKLLTVETTT